MVGSEALMRVSSATAPSSSGTFKSARSSALALDIRVPDARLGQYQRLGADGRRLQDLLGELHAAVG